MKTKLFLLLSFSMFMLGLKAQNISIPDANFKAKLLSSSPNNDYSDESVHPIPTKVDSRFDDDFLG